MEHGACTWAARYEKIQQANEWGLTKTRVTNDYLVHWTKSGLAMVVEVDILVGHGRKDAAQLNQTGLDGTVSCDSTSYKTVDCLVRFLLVAGSVRVCV